jgi:lipopolysaccharide cholinephosphotransferase
MSEEVTLSKEQLRQLQLNELELIVEVDRICRKNHIKYSLDGGTLLGAIRHKGFIPWDDDADVIFTRHEYAKFYRACKKDLKKDQFFLQEYRTDPYYRWGYAKMRHKETDYVRKGQEHMRYRTGVCIDVFVVDNVPDNIVLRQMNYYLNECLRKVLYSEVGQFEAPNPILRGWYRILHKIPRNLVFSIRNTVAAIHNRKPTELKSHLLFPYPKKTCKYGMPADSFDEYIDVEFEGMTFKGLKNYDRYLKLLYGDYMELPPEEKRYGINTASKIELKDIRLEEIQKRYADENARLN